MRGDTTDESGLHSGRRGETKDVRVGAEAGEWYASESLEEGKGGGWALGWA